MKYSPSFIGFDIEVGEFVPIDPFIGGCTHITNISLVKGNKARVLVSVIDDIEDDDEEMFECALGEEEEKEEKKEEEKKEEEKKEEDDDKPKQVIAEIDLTPDEEFQVAVLNEMNPDKKVDLKFGCDELPTFRIDGEKGTIVHIVGYCELIPSELESIFDIPSMEGDEDEIAVVPEKTIEEVDENTLKRKREEEGEKPEAKKAKTD